jgi:hypothetical protein
MYPATIAAVEAWQQAGGKRAMKYCKEIYAEFQLVLKKSAEDDARDDNNDGIADVDQISVRRRLPAALAAPALNPICCRGGGGNERPRICCVEK